MYPAPTIATLVGVARAVERTARAASADGRVVVKVLISKSWALVPGKYLGEATTSRRNGSTAGFVSSRLGLIEVPLPQLEDHQGHDQKGMIPPRKVTFHHGAHAVGII